MTARASILILALVVSVPVVAGAQAQSPQQRQAAAQLAEPKLDSNAIVAALDLTATPLKDVVAAIAKAGGITVRYHSGVTNLDAVSAVKLSNAKVEDALHTALDPKGLAFKVTGAKSVFIYPDTPANREKYPESVRTFPIAKADVDILVLCRGDFYRVAALLQQLGTAQGLVPILLVDAHEIVSDAPFAKEVVQGLL